MRLKQLHSLIFGYGNHRLCRWRHPVKALALSIERSELQVEGLIKEFVIEPRITKYNGIKMEVEYRMTDKATGELRTTGTSSHCFLNRSGRPISLKRSYPEIDTKFFEYTDI